MLRVDSAYLAYKSRSKESPIGNSRGYDRRPAIVSPRDVNLHRDNGHVAFLCSILGEFQRVDKRVEIKKTIGEKGNEGPVRNKEGVAKLPR